MLPILLTLTITIIFNILYSYAAAFPSDVGQYIVLVSRAMIGVGAGNAAVCRSYVSVATTQSERIGAFGIISAAQALGFIIGPVLGLAFVPLGSVGVSVDAIKFNFNMFTGPAYLSVVLAILNILLVVLFFREFRLIKRKTCSCRKVQKINIEESTRLVGSLSITNANINSTDTPSSRPRPFDKIASIICIAIFFAILFVFSVFETIIIPYSMDEFAWSKQQGQLYNNILFGVVSIISATVFISTRFIVRCVDERTALVCGMLLLSISVFILIPMGDDYPPVNMMLLSPGQSDVTHNGSSVIPLIDMTNTTSAGVGCRYPLISWCLDVPQLSLAQYILSVIVLTLGYPSSTVLCFTIFSKILGPHPQGVMMGLITAAGSFARTLGPLCVTTLYDETGPQITLAVVDGVVVIAVIVLVFTYYRLVPFGAKRGFSNKI
jgi:ceroid-lipofuscinosis MFS transporter 7